ARQGRWWPSSLTARASRCRCPFTSTWPTPTGPAWCAPSAPTSAATFWGAPSPSGCSTPEENTMASGGGDLPPTRHPWPCLLFVLPLVAAYEAGVVVLGGAHPETLRNGADNWLRCGLTAVGVQYLWVPPAALLLAFLAWAWGRWDDRPKDLLGVMTGMAIESVTFALGLWGLSRGLAPLLQRCGIALAVGAEGEPALRQVVTYLGAGIYEEALFRLVLFTLLVKLLRYV